MTTTLSAIVVAALGSVGAYFAWKTRKTALRREAADVIAKESAAAESKRSEIRDAVYRNDDEKLNQIVNQLMKD